MDNCEGCDARCCRKYLIAVIPSDIERISRKLGAKPADFLQLFPASECDCVWAPPFWVDGKETYVGLKRGKNGCVFLKGVRCSIHAFKPLVCSTFPSCLDGDRVVVSNACLRKEGWEDEGERVGIYHSGLAAMRQIAVEWNWKRGNSGSTAELFSFLLRHGKEERRISQEVKRFHIPK